MTEPATIDHRELRQLARAIFVATSADREEGQGRRARREARPAAGRRQRHLRPDRRRLHRNEGSRVARPCTRHNGGSSLEVDHASIRDAPVAAVDTVMVLGPRSDATGATDGEELGDCNAGPSNFCERAIALIGHFHPPNQIRSCRSFRNSLSERALSRKGALRPRMTRGSRFFRSGSLEVTGFYRSVGLGPRERSAHPASSRRTAGRR